VKREIRSWKSEAVAKRCSGDSANLATGINAFALTRP
jgi:hypothetical protein